MIKKLKVFIDANIFIAGSASSTGGSALILKACAKGLFQAVTSELILEEAQRNIQKNFKNNKAILEQFYLIVQAISAEISKSVVDISFYEKIIISKDVHVLTCAIESKSDYLITLDREHFFTTTISKAKLPIKIITPKDFIQTVLIKL